MTWANGITIGRLGIAVVCFVLLALAGRGDDAPTRVALVDAAFACFLAGAISDFLDGYVARRFGEETAFGRMADPLVDKILVCGTLVLMLGFADLRPVLPPWVVVVVVVREFIVQGIRSLVEGSGIPFGAMFWGKQKMVIQCVATGILFVYLAHRDLAGGDQALRVFSGLAVAGVVLMMLVTIGSGYGYLVAARRLLSSGAAAKAEKK